jgi:hypothetical protein
VREHRLATVCEEAKCPNIGECWNAGTATIMLMGAVCTRACRFCAVDTGNPRGWLDPEEPRNVARSVALMKLRYVVLTSVNRDDLPDGGAGHYAACIRAIKAANPQTAVEALTPDFQGNSRCAARCSTPELDVFAQNIETVRRLTHPVRDPRAGYEQTLPSSSTPKRTRRGPHEDERDARAGRERGRSRRPSTICARPASTLSRSVNICGRRSITCRSSALLRPRNLTPIGNGRSRAVFWSASRGRSCARATAPSRRSIATTRASNIAPAGAREPAGREAAERDERRCAGAGPAPVIRHLGRVDYESTWRAMQRLTAERSAESADEIWFLEHAPIFTLGMNARRAHLIAPGDIPVLQIDRGGQVTYHGPGQLVVYPLIDLKRAALSVRDLVSALEAPSSTMRRVWHSGALPPRGTGRVRR